MEVDCGAVGYDDLPGLGADEWRLHVAEGLAVVDPRYLALAPAGYAEGLPLVRHAQEGLLGVPAHEAEAVPVHVDRAGDVVEAAPEDGEGVLRVHPEGIIFVEFVLHSDHENKHFQRIYDLCKRKYHIIYYSVIHVKLQILISFSCFILWLQ